MFQALKTLPKGLFETHDRILENLNQAENVSEDDSKRVQRSLTWLANSARPLISAELTEAISVNPGDRNSKRTKTPMHLRNFFESVTGS